MESSMKQAFGLSGQGNEALSTSNMAMKTVPTITGSVSPVIAPMPTNTETHGWYPMRIAYGRAERAIAIKKYLDSLNIENFLPMKQKVDKVDGRLKIRLLPAISNLIFIHASQDTLNELKSTRSELMPLRYMMWWSHEKRESAIIQIPDCQMDNFMKVTAVQDERIIYLGNKDFTKKIGKPVRITGGVFNGVEGVIYRVKKDRRVVVALEGVTCVAIAYISPKLLREISV